MLGTCSQSSKRFEQEAAPAKQKSWQGLQEEEQAAAKEKDKEAAKEKLARGKAAERPYSPGHTFLVASLLQSGCETYCEG